MPEDVPLVSRLLNHRAATGAGADGTRVPRSGTAATGQHAWERGLRLWHGLFALVMSLVVGLLWMSSELPGRTKLTVTALLLAMAGWYALVGTRALRCHSWLRLWVYLTGMLALFVPTTLIFPSASLLLIGICAQCFMLMFKLRWALLAVAVFNAAPAIAGLRESNWQPRAIGGVLVWTVLGLGVSAVFALWIRGIIVQSAERAALIEQLEATRAELAVANHEAGALAERGRLAAEIHDTLAQGFTSVLMLLQAAEPEVGRQSVEARRHLTLAQETARENLAEARSLIAALTPARLEDGSLTEALRRLVDDVGSALGIAATFELEGSPRPLPSSIEVVLLRSTQEALANIRKHAGASRVRVRLGYGDDGAAPPDDRADSGHPGTWLEVRDDGRGFDPARVNGFGLRGMRTRVTQVGGTLEVDSSPGAGTTTRIRVP